LNQRITPARRFATSNIPWRACARSRKTPTSPSTMWCWRSARRAAPFLKELHALRPGADRGSAGIGASAGRSGARHAISFILANLGTDVADPVLRLNAIHQSTLRAKELLQGLRARR